MRTDGTVGADMHATVTHRRDLPSVVVERCAAATAFIALLAAACNLIALAIYFAVALCGCLIVRALLLAYRQLPEHDQNALLSRRALRRTAGASILLAAGISCFYWYAAWWLRLDQLPPEVRRFLVAHWRKLDFVPAVFSQLLPVSWQSGFHQYFNDMTYCFPGPYWWESMRYLRAAIPGYSLLLFICVGVVRLLARLLIQSGSTIREDR